MKSVYIILHILFLINGKGQEDKKEDRLIYEKHNTISSKWYGNYSLTINEDSEDWRNIHEIKLKIYKDSTIYLAEGFQLYQFYKLSAIEKNNLLQLSFEKALDNTDSWALKKTKNFGELMFDGKKYTWDCPYLNENFNNEKKIIYTLEKSN